MSVLVHCPTHWVTVFFLPYGRCDRLVEQLATLAPGTCLTPVGQEADMAHALQAVGNDVQEKAADALVGFQGHGLHAIALAAVAVGKVHLAILHIDDAVIGDGHTVGVAAERVEHVSGACQRPLGIDDPRLGLELVGKALEARGGSKGLGRLREHQGIRGGAGVECVEELAAEDRAQGVDGKEAPWMGRDPASPMIRQCSPWHQTVHVEMRPEGLIPGMQDLDAPELAPQVLAAELEQRLAGSPQ